MNTFNTGFDEDWLLAKGLHALIQMRQSALQRPFGVGPFDQKKLDRYCSRADIKEIEAAILQLFPTATLQNEFRETMEINYGKVKPQRRTKPQSKQRQLPADKALYWDKRYSRYVMRVSGR